MPRKVIALILMIGYLYTLEFGLFITEYLPAPVTLMVAVLLITLFGKFQGPYLYIKECILIFISCFLYYSIAQEDLKSFAVVLVVSVFCSFYFQFYVHDSRRLFNLSILIFFSFLILSTIIMYLDHGDQDKFDPIRQMLNGGDEIVQSPSGIAGKIFTFGYQIAALSVFLVCYALTSRKIILIVAAFVFAAIGIYYGMQRSALLDFSICLALFLVAYMPVRRLVVFGGVLGVLFLSVSTLDIASQNTYGDNIFSKNQRNQDDGEQRSNLVVENLKIYASYPYGLMFYNKGWGDVIRGNPAYPEGITSHNAYLMFVTYLGPFIGIILLVALFYRVGKIFVFCLNKRNALRHPLLVCLCFSFLSVSINSCFHNAWLLDMANGVQIFLYFSIIHYFEKFAKPTAA